MRRSLGSSGRLCTTHYSSVNARACMAITNRNTLEQQAESKSRLAGRRKAKASATVTIRMCFVLFFFNAVALSAVPAVGNSVVFFFFLTLTHCALEPWEAVRETHGIECGPSGRQPWHCAQISNKCPPARARVQPMNPTNPIKPTWCKKH